MREVVTSSRIIKDLRVTDECVMEKTNVLSGLLQRAESCPVERCGKTGLALHTYMSFQEYLGSQVQGLNKLLECVQTSLDILV